MTTGTQKTSVLEQEIYKNGDISIVNLVNLIIEEAEKNRASDVHISPTEKNTKIKFRIDGILQEAYLLPKNIHNEIISRIKVISKLRTDEHQSAQDGRFRYDFNNNKFIDIRVSIVPAYYGENAVLRLLSDKQENLDLEELGFDKEDVEKITKALKRQSGMILSTGPTGSGKTTTLYSLIKKINSSETSIVTIEDPIEYAIENIEQIQVNSKNGLTFANGLRSILRQDPDVIMVGEIRDKETANIAVNTSLTGHLLLSTIHTNDAVSVVPRLIDMGIEEYLIATTLNISIGQRLVRKICSNCKEESDEIIAHDILKDEKIKKIINQSKIYKGRGCKKCNHTGYKGRISINEIMVVDEEIRQAILKRINTEDIRKICIKKGMTTMFEDGCKKVSMGITTLSEIIRVTSE